jgi:hypothetical protein
LKAAERGARLTGQLLAFSRMQKLQIRPLDISEKVAGFAEMLHRSIGPDDTHSSAFEHGPGIRPWRSGSASDASIESCVECARCQHCRLLQKPFKIHELQSTLHELLRSSEQG